MGEHGVRAFASEDTLKKVQSSSRSPRPRRPYGRTGPPKKAGPVIHLLIPLLCPGGCGSFIRWDGRKPYCLDKKNCKGNEILERMSRRGGIFEDICAAARALEEYRNKR